MSFRVSLEDRRPSFACLSRALSDKNAQFCIWRDKSGVDTYCRVGGEAAPATDPLCYRTSATRERFFRSAGF